MENLSKKAVGRRIYALRKRLGLNQKEFGQQIGASNTVVSSYEVGDAYPSIEVLMKISAITNTTIDWLLIGFDMPILKDISTTERKLLALFRQTDKEGKKLIMQIAALVARKGEIQD